MSRIRADRYTNRLGTGAPLFSNGVNITGNVGVGTTVPTSKLTVLGDMNVTGKVSVGGTLTYEDVTSIDSVGIITARSGIHVTGTGSNGRLGIGTNNPGEQLHMYSSNSDLTLKIQTEGPFSPVILQFKSPSSGRIDFTPDTNSNASGRIVYSHVDDSLTFATKQPGGNRTDRVAITSEGYLQQHKLIAVSYSDTREIALSNTELTTSNFYNHTFFESDSNILDSNGHFVAPVHGIYRLFCRFSSDAVAGNRINVRLRKNGTTLNEAYCVNNAGSTNTQSASSEIIAELDKGEYFDLQCLTLETMPGAQHKVVNFHMLG